MFYQNCIFVFFRNQPNASYIFYFLLPIHPKENSKKTYDQRRRCFVSIIYNSLYVMTSDRERRSNSYWWAQSASAPKITERELKLVLIFALRMESHLPIFMNINLSKPQESQFNFRNHTSFLKLGNVTHESRPDC